MRSLNPLRSSPCPALLVASVLASACSAPPWTDPGTHFGEAIDRRLVGVWQVEHVEVYALEGLSALDAEGGSTLGQTWERTDRTNALLREERLTIRHVLNEDGTYLHTLDWADAPERRFVESGTWSCSAPDVISCINALDEPSSLPQAEVLHLDEVTLLVRMVFEGESQGKAEILRHRRITGPLQD